MAKIVFEKAKMLGSTYIENKGFVNNVSYLDPMVVEIPFWKAANIQILQVVKTSPLNATVTEIEIWTKDPSDPSSRSYDRRFKVSLGDPDNTNSFEALITNLPYASSDGSNKIWLKFIPEDHISNYYEILLVGTKLITDNDSFNTSGTDPNL